MVDINRSVIGPLIIEAKDWLQKGIPGPSLKLGRDLWLWAEEFPECYDLLDEAYAALGREPLRKLLREAQAFRKHCESERKS